MTALEVNAVALAALPDERPVGIAGWSGSRAQWWCAFGWCRQVQHSGRSVVVPGPHGLGSERSLEGRGYGFEHLSVHLKYRSSPICFCDLMNGLGFVKIGNVPTVTVAWPARRPPGTRRARPPPC